MLSIAIKNSLLVVLIILILHFMMKNYLIEKDNIFVKAQGQSLRKENYSQDIPKQEKEQKTDTSAHVTPPMNKAADDLFKFVFEDDTPITNQSPMCKQDKQTYIPEPSTINVAKPEVKQQPLNFENLVLNEYENESPLNGGHLYGSLSGYDSYSGDYVAL